MARMVSLMNDYFVYLMISAAVVVLVLLALALMVATFEAVIHHHPMGG